jgi:hypothetical protein
MASHPSEKILMKYREDCEKIESSSTRKENSEEIRSRKHYKGDDDRMVDALELSREGIAETLRGRLSKRETSFRMERGRSIQIF